MTCDLHCHSRYSYDGKDSLEAIYRSAKARNIDLVAITDHCDMVHGPGEVSVYLKFEAELRKEYEYVRSYCNGIDFLYGVEIGNAVDRPMETEKFLRSRKFDIVLGAIHFLPDGSDIYTLPYRNAQEIDGMFRSYFASVKRLVDFGGFDSLAHLEYPVRALRGKIPVNVISRHLDLIYPILESLVCQGIALEVNTRGTYDWQKQVGPGADVLRLYRELGGRLVTIGSDTHRAPLVGEGFRQAVDALLQSGFDSYTVYRGRKARQVPLKE